MQSISVEEAVARLRAGELVLLPTETVYGLAGDATSNDAALKIFEAKGRPRFNPLICHCADEDIAVEHVDFHAAAKTLAEAFWPGPLTLVLPRKLGSPIADLATAGLPTVAIRVPQHPEIREVLRAFGGPVAAPSANPSGTLSTTSAAAASEAFEGKIPVLDGGPCRAGLESTIMGFSADQPVLLRSGAIAREDIEAALGRPVTSAGDNAEIVAPGMLLRHYAPAAKLRLNARGPEGQEAWLGFGKGPATGLNLSLAGDLREAARNLFAYLRQIDADGPAVIAVAAIPETGLGEAINDRLRRAAASSA